KCGSLRGIDAGCPASFVPAGCRTDSDSAFTLVSGASPLRLSRRLSCSCCALRQRKYQTIQPDSPYTMNNRKSTIGGSDETKAKTSTSTSMIFCGDSFFSSASDFPLKNGALEIMLIPA